jgi:hypothetical protein
MPKSYHNIGFREKRHFSGPKSAKIADISDHNIDPWSLWLNGTYKTVTLEILFRESHLHLQQPLTDLRAL